MYSVMVYEGNGKWKQIYQTDLFECVLARIDRFKKEEPEKQVFVFNRMMHHPPITPQFDIDLTTHLDETDYSEEINTLYEKWKKEGKIR